MRPCGHANPEQQATCYACRLYLNNDDYRRLWDAPRTAVAATPRRVVPCVHRGADVYDEHGRAVTRDCGLG